MSMNFSEAVPIAWQVLLERAMVQCAEAGFGRIETAADGTSVFEAYPGQDDAAADFIERTLFPECDAAGDLIERTLFPE